MTIKNEMNLIEDDNNINAPEMGAKKINEEQEISSKEISDLKEFYWFSKTCGTGAIICFCLFLLFIPIIIMGIIELVWCVKCLTLNSKALKQDCMLWGILGLLVLPIVPIFVMKNKALNIIVKHEPNFNSKKNK
ncbi:MAG: hypothetical protein RR201_01950 [Malacoplasma sp.]